MTTSRLSSRFITITAGCCDLIPLRSYSDFIGLLVTPAKLIVAGVLSTAHPVLQPSCLLPACHAIHYPLIPSIHTFLPVRFSTVGFLHALSSCILLPYPTLLCRPSAHLLICSSLSCLSSVECEPTISIHSERWKPSSADPHQQSPEALTSRDLDRLEFLFYELRIEALQL